VVVCTGREKGRWSECDVEECRKRGGDLSFFFFRFFLVGLCVVLVDGAVVVSSARLDLRRVV
jgi:hypothetical protein